MSLNSINSDFSLQLFGTFPLQVGGLRPAVHPTWMAYITPAHPVWFVTMVLSGTIGRVQIWWLPWQPWWCARQTCDGMAHSWCQIIQWMSYPMNIMNNTQEMVHLGRTFFLTGDIFSFRTCWRGALALAWVHVQLSANDCAFSECLSEKFHSHNLFTLVPKLYFNMDCSAERELGARGYELCYTDDNIQHN